MTLAKLNANTFFHSVTHDSINITSFQPNIPIYYTCSIIHSIIYLIIMDILFGSAVGYDD